MVDIHDRGQKLERNLANVKSSEDISDSNRETLLALYRWLMKQKLSKSRILRYIQTGKTIAEHNDFDLRPMTEEKLVTLTNQIDESAYYHKEYAPSTKEEYWKFLRTFCKFDDGLSVNDDVPDRADFVPTTAEKEFTKPSELIKPRHVKAACRSLINLRDQAFLLTQWDTGSRIGETAACKLDDFYRENGRWMLHIHGNKDSPDRDAWIHIAAPAIRRWLNERHPAPDDGDAYLFCKLKPIDPHSVPVYNSFRKIAEKAKREADIDKALQRTHLFRKSRVSYLKSAMNMAESAIDKRIGHVMNSETTRRYTRIGDEASNRNYGARYDLDVDEEQEEDLVPQECTRCGEVNAGFRDRCYECHSALTALQQPSVENQKEQAKSLIVDAMQEEGMIDQLQEVLSEGGQEESNA